MKNINSGLTLIETLIGIVLLSVIIIGFFNIEYFARAQVLFADRRVKVHNEAIILMEHMAKNLSLAIGNIPINGINGNIDTNVFDITPINGDVGIVAYIDGPAANGDGLRGANDYRIGYRYRGAGPPATERYQVWFYPAYVTIGNHGPSEVIASDVTNLVFTTSANNNFIGVDATFCFDAVDNLATCGTAANPSENLSANIALPMVSVR